MVIIMKPHTPKEEVVILKQRLQEENVEVNEWDGENFCVLGLIGDTTKIDESKIEANEYVERVHKVQQPYKLANRLFHPDNTMVEVEDQIIGGRDLTVIAGPCSVESEEQIVEIAKLVKKSGAGFLRGGAFKPRTSPYSFQGLKTHGLELLKIAKQETGLPIVTEIMTADMIERFVEDVDVIQVGARCKTLSF